MSKITKEVSKFESGHPDKIHRAEKSLKPASKAGFIVSHRSDENVKMLAHFGALEGLSWSDLFELGGENPTSKQDEMIKEIKIKDYNGDLSKRWHVEYRDYNPEQNTWVRKREYGYVNREKNAESRTKKLNQLYLQVLAEMSSEKKLSLGADYKYLNYYIETYINHKQRSCKIKSIDLMKGTLKPFYLYLYSLNLHRLDIREITKEHIRNFLNESSKNLSNRSVNNHLDFLKMFFNFYMNEYEDLIFKNPCKGIKKRPADSETHVAYSEKQKAEIYNYILMDMEDPQLLLYVKTIGMGFMRCDESRFVKIRDIDFINKIITMPAANAKVRKRAKKPMLESYYQELIAAGIDKYHPDNFLFSYGGHPGPKQVHYNYFTKRFKRVKKKFNLGKVFTIYGFRHTTVCRMLKNKAPWIDIMKYTGHTTMDAFSKYARAILNAPAEDLSAYL